MADIKITTGPATPPPSASAPVTSAAPKPAAPVTATAAAPAAVKTAAPAAPLVAVPASAKPSPSFQNIFTKTTKTAEQPKMIESIVAGKATVKDKLKPILGSAPQLQKTLEQEREYRQKKALKRWQIIFAVVLVAGLGSTGYFYTELSPTFTLFGQNTTVKLGLVNENLKSTQTGINKYGYMMAQTTLNSFSYIAEQYLDTAEKLSDPNLTPSEKGVLTAKLSEQETMIIPTLKDLKSYLAPDLVYKTTVPEGQPVPTDEELQVQYQDALRAALELEKSELLASATGISAENQASVRLIDNAIKIVGNNALIGTVKGLNLETLQKDLDDFSVSYDAVLRKKIQTMFRNILSTTSSDIAVIATLKAQRIDWSTLIQQIADVTKQVDPNFSVASFRNELIEVTGGVNYDSLEFDAQTNTISVTGNTITTDATNFTTISDLIDEFEASPYFTGVEMRSFTKSGTPEEGFTANFNFALELENPDEAENPAAETVSLSRDGLKARTGVRRIRNQ